MRYVSLFSGIEAATVAWHPLGWEPAAFAEIEKFPSAVLAHHYPNVPNLGDVTKADWDAIGPVDLLVGGSPCQSFSVAGKRLGLDDPRGNLALFLLQVVGRIRPRWVVYENVPGLLSSDEGRDFGTFLGALAKLGYGFAYRVLDAQFLGVAQRRRRVFVVGHAGGLWQRAAAVLFEPESLRGDPAPRRASREGSPAGTLERTCGDYSRQDPHSLTLVPFDPIQITSKANRSRCLPGSAMHTLPAAPAAPAVAYAIQERAVCENPNAGPDGAGFREGTAYTVEARGTPQAVASNLSAVRRLTPTECERLQGFPDSYTAIPGAKDGPRYRALGNSMAVPVMAWIGRRLDAVDRACRQADEEAA